MKDLIDVEQLQEENACLRARLASLEHLETNLSDGEEKFRRMLETANEGVIVLDRDARITLINRQMESMLGYENQELLGKRFESLLFEKDLEDHWAQMQLREQGKSTVYERCFRRKNGSILWTVISATAIVDADGRFNGSFGMITDITERKQAQSALKLSEEKFAKAFRMNPSAIVLARTRDARVVDVNDTFTRIFGFSRDEIIGSSTLEKGIWVDSQDRDRLLTHLANGAVLNDIEVFFNTKDKRVVTCSSSFEAIEIDGEMHILGVFEDITDHKKAETALRESHVHLNRILENLQDAYFQADLGGKFSLVNPAAVKMFGYISVEEMIGKAAESLYANPKDRDFLIAELRKVGHLTDWSCLALRNDGTTFWVSMNVQFAKDETGQIVGTEGAVRDITERKLSEERLLESEARFRGIIEDAPIAISIGRNGQLLYANPAYVRWHGFSNVEELIGLPTVERVAAHHRDLTNERARRRAKDLPVEAGPYELTGLSKDGTEIPMLAAVSQVKLADGPANIGFFQDITLLKQAEKALRESEARFRDVLENSSGASYKRNLTTNHYDYLSPVFTKISGYTPDEFINLPLETVLELIHPDDRENGERVIAQSISGAHGSSYSWDYRFKHKDRHYRWLHDQFTLIRDSQGQALAWIGSVSDITERKQRENELQAIASISAVMRTVSTRAEMLPVIVAQLVSLLQCDSGSAGVVDPLTNETIIEAAYGDWDAVVGFRHPAETGLNALIAETRRPYHNNHFSDISQVAIPGIFFVGIQAIAGVPMISQDQIIGMLWVGRKTDICESEVRLLEAVADMTASALNRAALHERTQKSAADLSHAYDTTLEGWAHALELRDHETEGHARNVVQLTLRLARVMGVADDQLEHIRRGALLHDIGKMGIPDSVLLKPGTLNEREWEIMQRHPEYAYQLLNPIEYLRPVLDIPYYHHEKWDGSGYPRGLKGEEIPLAARLFAIVDVWDALRTDRVYRKAWEIEKALKYIVDQSGSHFDPNVVHSFLQIIGTGNSIP